MTGYIVIAALLVAVALFLLFLEISDRLLERENEPLSLDEAVEHLQPRGNVNRLERQNGSG